jgi:hypothetical protein
MFDNPIKYTPKQTKNDIVEERIVTSDVAKNLQQATNQGELQGAAQYIKDRATLVEEVTAENVIETEKTSQSK